MSPAEIIIKKRDGQSLTADEIRQFVQGFASGSIPDYQMAALAMAICLRGMSAEETSALTSEMLASGTTLPRSDDGRPRVDKHSTGGIGDKVSLVLAPLLACCGLVVPMISGRGLGASGGTLDKLEAIPGFRTELSQDELRNISEQVGCVICGTTHDLAPADRKLYQLRDVTGTIESVPLITSSIMSKKLAESLDALVLDVKFGSGAFMKTLEDARELAASLVRVGANMNVKTTALLTDMNQPLGRMIGNAVEVDESVATLEMNGPADLQRLVLALGAELLVAAGISRNLDAATATLNEQLTSGNARQKFDEMVIAQNGDPRAVRQVAPASEWSAPRSGYVAGIDANKLGWVIIELGGGRKVMTDRIHHEVGIEMLVRLGDKIDQGQPAMRVFADPADASRIRPLLDSVIQIADNAIAESILIAGRLVDVE
ncbi:MAG: thymidine phosphorylase [Pirellulales bacterium]